MISTARQTPQIEEHLGQPPSAAAQRDLGALRQAVGQALDRKRRLGQYAVVWQGAEVRRLSPEALPAWIADADRADARYVPTPLAQLVAAWEPLPDGLEDPQDLPPQARDPL